MKLKNIIKKCAKKILNDDVKIINTKINYENFSKAMKDLIKRNKALLSSEDHFGKRPDNKDFYPVVKKIENGFNLLFKELNEYDEDGYIPPLEAQTVSSGNPIKSKPFPMCEEFILKTLLKRSLYQYPSITGNVKCKAHVVNYLIREGFREKTCKGYDGIGVENVVFTCSTTQGFQFVLETILRDEDVILVTGPNYGLFAIAPERINARVEVLNLCEEDNFFVNPKKLANKIDEINLELKNKFKDKLNYIPKVAAFLNINPHNPIGNVMSKKNIDILKGIGDVCLEKGVFVIDDLIYRDLTYDRDNLALPLASMPKYFNNTITLLGLSKAYGLASFRAACVIAPIPICNGLNEKLFCNVNTMPVLQVNAMAGAYNGTNKRYRMAKRYFKPLIKKYIHRLNLFRSLIEGIDVIEEKSEKNKIIREINRCVKNKERASILLNGIENLEIRKNTLPTSGFFAIVDFTRLKGKTIDKHKIKNEQDLIRYLYKKSKFKTIMGENMSWPYEDEIIGRFDFAIDLKDLISNIWKLHLSLDRRFVCIKD